jgi:hypothetical protein
MPSNTPSPNADDRTANVSAGTAPPPRISYLKGFRADLTSIFQQCTNTGVAPGPALAGVTNVDTAVQRTLHVFTSKTADHVKLSSLALCAAAKNESPAGNAAFKDSLKQHLEGLTDAQLFRVWGVFWQEPAFQMPVARFIGYPRNLYHAEDSITEYDSGRQLVRSTIACGGALFRAVHKEMRARGLPPYAVREPEVTLNLGLSVARDGLMSGEDVTLPNVRDVLLPAIARNVQRVRHDAGVERFIYSSTRP